MGRCHERTLSGRPLTSNAFSVRFAPLRTVVRIRAESMTPAPRVAFVSILATLAYLGLAILGWGGFAAFFSHPALVALTGVVFVLAGAALFSEGNLSPGEREDRA